MKGTQEFKWFNLSITYSHLCQFVDTRPFHDFFSEFRKFVQFKNAYKKRENSNNCTYLESKWLRSIDSPSLSHWISGMGFPLAAQSRVTSEPCKAFVLWGVARNKGNSCSVCLPGKRKMEFVIYFLLKHYLNFVSKMLILRRRNVWNSLWLSLANSRAILSGVSGMVLEK